MKTKNFFFVFVKLSVERKNELKLKAKNLDDMIDLVKKTAYVNKETYPKQGLRSIQLSTLLKYV